MARAGEGASALPPSPGITARRGTERGGRDAVGVDPRLTSLNHIAGSLIGGIAETQEMLDFCAQHGLGSDIEIIPISAINDAYDRMLRGDVKYRFVIDMQSLKTERTSAPPAEVRLGG